MIIAGCAKGDPPPAAPTHAHFARIQQHEARIAEARATVRREMATESPDCARACRGWTEAARAADALCEVARDVDDADAQTRCDRARAAGTELKTRVTARCPCDGAGEGP